MTHRGVIVGDPASPKNQEVAEKLRAAGWEVEIKPPARVITGRGLSTMVVDELVTGNPR